MTQTRRARRAFTALVFLCFAACDADAAKMHKTTAESVSESLAAPATTPQPTERERAEQERAAEMRLAYAKQNEIGCPSGGRDSDPLTSSGSNPLTRWGVIKASIPLLERCYDQARSSDATHKSASAHHIVEVMLKPDGRTKAVKVLGDSFGNLRNCIKHTASRWYFADDRTVLAFRAELSFAVGHDGQSSVSFHALP